MAPVALITGATAGIGREAARQLAAEGHHLVLVARHEVALHRLASEITQRHPEVKVEVLAADLSTREGRRPVAERLASATVPIDLFFNNAGLGYGTPTTDNTVEAEMYLLEVNAVAKVELMLHALRAMRERGRGDIINVSSVAGMGPAAWVDSLYGPSKALVLAASEAMGYARRIRRSPVRVMALCPGDVRTEFNTRAGIPDSVVPAWRYIPVELVVRSALRDLRRGKVVSTPSLRYKVLGFFVRHLPRTLTPLFAWDLGAYADGKREER